jgi:hypothetical protein
MEPYAPTAWFSHVWFLYQLQRAGFPFAQDDLSMDEWLALGEMKIELEIPRVPDGK